MATLDRRTALASEPLLAASHGPRVHLPLALGLWLFGCAAAVLVFLRADEQAERDARDADGRDAAVLAASVAQALAMPTETLRGLSGLVSTFPSVGSEAFREYADHMAREQPAVTGMHVRQLVEASARALFERERGLVIRDPSPASSSRSAPARPQYLPIVRYAEWEPRGTLGQDILGSDVASRVEKTVSDGAPTAYLRRGGALARHELCLLEAAGPRARPDAPAADYAEVCVDLDALVQAGIADNTARERLSLSIFDLTSPAGQHLVYPLAATSERPSDAAWSSGGALAQRDVRLGGRAWRIRVVRSVLGPARARPYGVLVAGLAAASLLAGLGFALGTLARLRQRLSRVERLGQYVLEEKLGEGGMGVVFRARHSLLRRPTAVKVMPLPASLGKSRALARFEQEVRITASLSHPNTIAVYDFGHTRDGGFYYAMEYLEGLDLQRLVNAYGPQSEARVVHILLQAVGALAEAHERGLIHRDVKPANLMLCSRGGILDFVKVLDFGLVKDMRAPEELERRDFMGTPHYAAPEATLAPQSVDARSDLYALGAVAFFLLSGREVFRGSRVIDVLEQHVSAKPPSLAELGTTVSSELEALIAACLAKSPASRPASATALRGSLASIARAAPWTEHDAQQWWAEHAASPAPCAAPPASSAAMALGATLLQVDDETLLRADGGQPGCAPARPLSTT